MHGLQSTLGALICSEVCAEKCIYLKCTPYFFFVRCGGVCGGFCKQSKGSFTSLPDPREQIELAEFPLWEYAQRCFSICMQNWRLPFSKVIVREYFDNSMGWGCWSEYSICMQLTRQVFVLLGDDVIFGCTIFYGMQIKIRNNSPRNNFSFFGNSWQFSSNYCALQNFSL